MESLKVAFLKDGNHVHHKELYNRISKYSEILKAEEGEMLDAFEETKTEPKKKENKKSSYFVFGAIVAGLFAIGAFIHSKFKKNTNKKENI